MLAKGLAELGVDITLMTIRSENMNTYALEGTTAKLKVLSPSFSKKEIAKHLAEERFDLIQIQSMWDLPYHKVMVEARKLGIPYIVTPRGMLDPWSLAHKKWKKKLAMLLYQKKDLQRANCILATADMEADHVRDLGIIPPIAIIPNGIDVSEYECRSLKDKASVKKQIVFLSRIHEKKGIEFLIDAWENLQSKYPDWNVVIAGNGETDYIEQLKQKITAKGLQKCMEIVPPVFGVEKHKLYCESSLFVLPTYSENFGMVVAEAMSCGVPVITTNGTPWQELNELKLGWCIDLSIDNLIKAISEAVGLGADTLFNMGQKCSLHIRNTYQYTEVAAKNKAVYVWLTKGGDVPSCVRF
jgi:glycosyltransferase involved in cell wall biosynthesis